jgi:hypothetical protein
MSLDEEGLMGLVALNAEAPRALLPLATPQIRLEVYKEVVAQFRALTDIRFKLLTLLPLGTVATIFLAKDDSLIVEPVVAAFALIVTICVATYNKRNDQHYDELIAIAGQFERDLGLTTGGFSQRPAPWLRYGVVRVEHRWPIGLTYAATAALWAALLGNALVVRFKLEAPFDLIMRIAPPAALLAGWYLLKPLERRHQKKLKELVISLVNDIKQPRDRVDVTSIAHRIGKEGILACSADTAERRLAYHLTLPQEPDADRRASALLSAAIDLPARWIYDVSTGRR